MTQDDVLDNVAEKLAEDSYICDDLDIVGTYECRELIDVVVSALVQHGVRITFPLFPPEDIPLWKPEDLT